MSKFKVGDFVVLTGEVGKPCETKAKIGHTYKIAVSGGDTHKLDVDFLGKRDGTACWINKDALSLDTSNYHVHYDVIIAWAKGAEIEYFSSVFGWRDAKNPCFSKEIKYRVKLPLTPTQLRIKELESELTHLKLLEGL
jgi:hypothetical protein